MTHGCKPSRWGQAVGKVWQRYGVLGDSLATRLVRIGSKSEGNTTMQRDQDGADLGYSSLTSLLGDSAGVTFLLRALQASNPAASYIPTYPLGAR